MNRLILIIIGIIGFACSYSQNESKYIEFELSGKEHKNLFMVAHSVNNSLSYPIKGEAVDKYSWKFVINDSLYNDTRYFNLMTKYYDGEYREEELVLFQTIKNGDTIKFSNIFYDPKIKKFKANYEKEIIRNFPEYVTADNQFISDATITFHIYDVDYDLVRDTELEAIISSANFGISPIDSYDACLDNTRKIAKRYPYSNYLMYNLDYFKDTYNSKDDLKSVYNLFDDEVKNSYRGKTVKEYFNFDPLLIDYYKLKLLEVDSDRENLILQDKEKYGLILFSASWCGPCHKQIPILKEIYNDLKSNLELVYITLDDAGSIESWKQLMKNENIPWRYFTGANSSGEIKLNESIKTIPLTLFVYPDGKIKSININKGEDIELLYKIIKKAVNVNFENEECLYISRHSELIIGYLDQIF